MSAPEELQRLHTIADTSPQAQRLVDALGDVSGATVAELVRRADTWRRGEHSRTLDARTRGRMERTLGTPIAVCLTWKGSLTAFDVRRLANRPTERKL